ncbi:hypothetical protein VNI00_010330 [Paramarasmius palmivorus]|uniref:Uncharacterized protein n=1 Tax=Paramarasmius palmivorus TaxID=297713 RepID=A0AAW0CIY3_9AGAR
MIIPDFVSAVTRQTLDLSSYSRPSPTICDIRPTLVFYAYSDDIDMFDEDLRLLNRRIHKFLKGSGSFSTPWRPTGLQAMDSEKYARRSLFQIAAFPDQQTLLFPLTIDVSFTDIAYQEARISFPLDLATGQRHMALVFDKEVSGVILDQMFFNDWFMAELANAVRNYDPEEIEISLDF